uniref:Uncharacterized protein n=1 Tax=Anguilla anguilla TaxID=7936 RepID=A0A0E9VLG0_ANGAN
MKIQSTSLIVKCLKEKESMTDRNHMGTSIRYHIQPKTLKEKTIIFYFSDRLN